MHTFVIREGGPGRKAVRTFMHLDLPTNPICWLFGHRAKVEIIEPKYSEPWRQVRCRICDLRYTNPDFTSDSLLMLRLDRERTYTARDLHEIQRQRGQEMAEGQVEVARRDPKQVEESCSGRQGYGTRKVTLGAAFYAYKPTKARLRNVGFRLHTGTRSSETPLDAHLDLGVVAIYLQVGGIGGRWCEWIGRGHGRDISLSIHGGQLWWKLWYDGDSGNDEHHRCDSWRRPKLWPWSQGRRKHRGWMCLRDGNIELNPVSAFYGSRKYLKVEDGVPRQALVVVGQFPGDEYLVKFQRDVREIKREHGPAWARKVKERYYSVEWDAHIEGQVGIPIRNHEWKGDEILSGNLPGEQVSKWSGDDWLPNAVEGLRDMVLRDRERYDYRPPTPADAS